MKKSNLLTSLFIKSCAILVVLGLAHSAHAWGNHGHRLIALIAERHLSTEAQMAITELSAGESFFDMSTWADEMRSSKDSPIFWSYDYAANWHFINIAKDQHYAQSRKAKQGDAYSALLAFIAILTDKAPQSGPVKDGLELYLGSNLQTMESKRLALKFLIHVIADLHQPMHVGYPEDRGGNNIDVYWKGNKFNLHALWDSKLFENQTIEQHLVILLNKAQLMTDSDISKLAATDAELWIEEGLLLRDQVYTQTPLRPEEPEYTAVFAPIADEQLIKAGLRTAYLLNTLFNSEH